MFIPVINQTVLQGCVLHPFSFSLDHTALSIPSKTKTSWVLPLSLKSSTRMISAIRLSGVRLMMLWIVRKSEVQPSLWNGMMMLVFGSVSKYTLCLQLQRQWNNCITILKIWVGKPCHTFWPLSQHGFWYKIQHCNQEVLSCENSWIV